MSGDESPRDHSVAAALLPWQKKPRFSWTPAYETTFFQSLCQSVQLGLRENMSFKPEAWSRALSMLNEQGAYPTKSHLINKTDNARKKFRLWRGLMENPQFTFDPTTRIIKGSEEAWTAHLEKEPLARALRERPFENAEYLEILFPDVVGSGGQPKRVTKPRRKGPDTIPGGEVPPGTSVIRLANAPVGSNANVTPMRNNSGVSGINPIPVPVPSSNTQQSRQQAGSGNANVQQMRANMQNAAQGAAQNSSIQPPPPPQGAGGLRQGGVGGLRAAHANALTPPDETNGANNAAGQKRFAANNTSAPATASKRRRTDGNINANNANRGRAEQATAAPTATAAPANTNQTPAASRVSSISDSTLPTGRQVGAAGAATGGAGVRTDGITGLLSDVLSKYAAAANAASTTRWLEQAMDILFSEFVDEDMEVQVRFAEKVLTDTHKAIMFCKMSSALRKHWVKRLRDALRPNQMGGMS